MMKRFGLRISLAGGLAAMAMGLAMLAGVGFSDSASALTNCTVSDNSVDSEEQAFLGLINQYRAQNGLSSLAMSTNLNRAATWLGGDMGAKKYFSHTDSLGRAPSQRVMDCGYPSGAGENIAAGGSWGPASAVFAAWKASSGHNANMLNSSYKYIGIARVYTAGSPYGWYWVTDFGLVNDGTGSATGGGTSPTPTPIPTSTPTSVATPQTGSPASISSPANGSTLGGGSATFTWNAAGGALEYFFYAGTSLGANNIVGRSTGTATSTTVTNLPTDGSTIYVRLWTRFSAGWQSRDFTYRAAAAGGGGTTTSAKAVMTSPAPGSQLTSTIVTFQWSGATGASQYFLYIGTSVGANNLLGTSTGLNLTLTVSNVPRGGQPLYVRLWTLVGSTWQYNDYTYRAAP